MTIDCKVKLTPELEDMLNELASIYYAGMGSADLLELAVEIADYILVQQEELDTDSDNDYDEFEEDDFDGGIEND